MIYYLSVTNAHLSPCGLFREAKTTRPLPTLAASALDLYMDTFQHASATDGGPGAGRLCDFDLTLHYALRSHTSMCFRSRGSCGDHLLWKRYLGSVYFLRCLEDLNLATNIRPPNSQPSL